MGKPFSDESIESYKQGEAYNRGYRTAKLECEAKVKEAKTNEKTRICTLLEKEYPAICTWPCWQTITQEELSK